MRQKGKELIASGRGEITEFGILFRNEEIMFDEVYDGQVFPQYIYEECLAIAELTYQEKRNMPIFRVRRFPSAKHCTD